MSKSVAEMLPADPVSSSKTFNLRAIRHRLNWSIATLLVLTSAVWLAGCTTTPKSNQEIQQQAAEDTAKAKQATQDALADTKVAAKQAAEKARVAAGKAEDVVTDVAAGVKQGLNANTKPSASTPVIDLNSATTTQLTSLPGISRSTARNIVNARPLGTSHDLVDRNLVTESEYARISNRITVN